jgi:hypothetical protein
MRTRIIASSPPYKKATMTDTMVTAIDQPKILITTSVAFLARSRARRRDQVGGRNGKTPAHHE